MNIRRIWTSQYTANADDVILVKSNQATVIDLTAIDTSLREGKELEIVNANSSGDVTTNPVTETIAPGAFLRIRAVDGSWKVLGVKTTAGAGGPHTHSQSDITGLSSALSGKVDGNDSRLSDARTPTSHSHAQSDVTGLLASLAAKVNDNDSRLSDARTPTAHTHAQSEVTGLVTALANKVETNDSRLSDARTPLAHNHAQSDITGLTTALANKCATDDPRLSDARAPLAHSHAQSDVTGLVSDLAGKASASHTHAQSDITGLTTALAGKQATSEKGQANGYASLGSDGKVPSAQLPELGGGSIPAGVIVMWSGLLANIPSGWVLCDGQNGTPDLRSRFIKGASGEPGSTGGNLSHTHANHSNLVHSGTAVADHPSHTHTYSEIVNHMHPVNINDPGHSHLTQRYPTATGGSSGFTIDTSMSGTPADNTLATKAANTGITATSSNPAGGLAQGTTNGPSATLSHSVTQPNDHTISAHDSVNHEPPFFGLAFIMKS